MIAHKALSHLFLNSMTTFSTILHFTECSFKNLNQNFVIPQIKNLQSLVILTTLYNVTSVKDILGSK